MKQIINTDAYTNDSKLSEAVDQHYRDDSPPRIDGFEVVLKPT